MRDSLDSFPITATTKFVESPCNKKVTNEIAKDTSSSKSTSGEITREPSKSTIDLFCPESLLMAWDDYELYETIPNEKKHPSNFHESEIARAKLEISSSTQSISPQLYPLAL